MGNILIAVFVAMFFWGKANKKTREKTKDASVFRTFVYLVLSIFVGVFFYKTYQVATIYNGIQVSAFKASYDSLGRITDTIPTIEIYNRFSSLSYNNLFLQTINNREDSKTSKDYFSEIGGVRFEIISHNDSDYVVKETPIVNNNPLSVLSLPKDNPDQVYAVAVFMTGIPNLIPVYPKVKYNSGWEKSTPKLDSEIKNSSDSVIVFTKSIMNEMKDDPNITYVTEGGPVSNMPTPIGYVFKQFGVFYDTNKTKAPYVSMLMFARNAFSNTLNIFTAADISQYTHMISINSDCHIKEMAIDYDIPIETSQITEDMKVAAKAIVVEEKMLDQFLNGQSFLFHVKLPTMANIQLIRSLVLTALISALLSLLSQNLYYLMRKWACYYRKKYKLPYSKAKLISKKQVRNFRRVIFFFLSILLLILLLVSYLLFNNITLGISKHLYEYGWHYLLGVILLMILVICWRYSKLRNPKLPDLNEDKNPEEPPSIFVHDKNEDEEYDRLVQEMLNESNNDDQIKSN